MSIHIRAPIFINKICGAKKRCYLPDYMAMNGHSILLDSYNQINIILYHLDYIAFYLPDFIFCVTKIVLSSANPSRKYDSDSQKP